MNSVDIRIRRIFYSFAVLGAVLASGAVFGFFRITRFLFETAPPVAGAADCGCAAASSALIGGNKWIYIIMAAVLGIIILGGISRVFWTIIVTKKFIRQSLRFKTKIGDDLRAAAKEVGVADCLYETEDESPRVFCFGLVRPKISVSKKVAASLNRAELRAVLLHERHHLLRRDPLRAFIINIITGMFWFLPGMRRAAENFRSLAEFAADDAVVFAEVHAQNALNAALLKMSELHKKDAEINIKNAAVAFFSLKEIRLARIRQRNAALNIRFDWKRIVFSALVITFSVFVVFLRLPASGRETYPAAGKCAAKIVSCSNLWHDAVYTAYPIAE